ncbi:MAG: MarR family winged helix-turn-helix transcriptional regulator [Candidatus Eiseniibacteriota bacterium]
MPNSCAGAVLETSMLVMRAVRRELGRQRPHGLSVTQLRGLACVDTQPGASLSELASFIGLTMPAASRLAASLVRRRLLAQRVARGDRRRSELRLTAPGRTALHGARRLTLSYMSGVMARLTPAERSQVAHAMRRVRPLLVPTRLHGVSRHGD